MIAKGEIPELDELQGSNGKRYKRRKANNRPENGEPIYTCYRCDNDELMAKATEMYFREGDRIADVTFGRGAFWRLIDTSLYDFFVLVGGLVHGPTPKRRYRRQYAIRAVTTPIGTPRQPTSR